MKALVCGNAPCFKDEVKDKDLSTFFIVRMNGFITPPFLECNAWSSWPEPEHRLKHAKHEPMYRVFDYATVCDELWLVHPTFLDLSINKFKRHPDYILSRESEQQLSREIGSSPNMGMLMIKACMEQERFKEIYVCGFDFYESENDYYFCEGKFNHPAHIQKDNKRWFVEQLGAGRIKLL